MRLTQVMAGAAWGGAEGFFERLALAFGETDIDQRLVLKDIGDRPARLAAAGLQATTLTFGGTLDFWSPRLLGHRLRRWQTDVVLSWMNRGAMTVPRGGPWVHAARLGGFYNLRYYRTADWLIGLTPAIVDHVVVHGWPRERTVYLPNFVEDRTEPHLDLPTTIDGPVILAYGRLHVNKAFDTLIKAMAAVPDAALVLFGDGPEAAALKACAAETGVGDRVHFMGWHDRPQAFLHCADVFVCPSRHEPHGNVILEGMAAGLPMVSTATHGADHLLADEVTALICPIDDPAAMADRLSRLLADRVGAEALGAAASAAAETYSKANVVAAYRGFFERIIA